MPKPSQPQRELVPAGNHVGRVFSVIHIGVIPTEYQGQLSETDKIRISWELPLETKVFKEGEDARPFVIAEEYSFTMGKKSNLRPIVEGIIGTSLTDQEAFGFEINDLISMACMVNVIHKESGSGNMYAKVASTAGIPKGMTVPDQVNPTFILDFDENWDGDKFDGLPQFIKEKILSSRNYARKFQENEPFASDRKIEMTSVADMDFEAVDADNGDLNPEDIELEG